MESYQPPFESSPDPDETGLVEGSKKKKKKTTRIPKSTGILPKVEAEEASKKDSPEKPFEKMFAKETEEKDSEDKDKSPEIDLVPDPATEGEEVLPEQEFEVLEEEPVDLPDSLEGEFAEEGMIISRADAPKAEAKPQVASEAPTATEAIPEPASSSNEAVDAPELPIERPTVSETPPPPVSRTMYESGARFEPAIMAERLRTESTEATITMSEHEREVHYARKRATSRGVLAGGVFGYWLGRRGRKAAETEATEAHQAARKQSKKIERLESEQAIAAERFRNIQSTQAELINHTRVVEQQPVKAENMPAAEVPAAEKIFEKQKIKAEIAPEEQLITEEIYKAPEGRRVETSSWHRYEVDEKTGRVVENPAVAYGQEFQKEQKQERLQRPAAEPFVAAQLGQAIIQNTDTSNPGLQPYAGTSVTEGRTGKNSGIFKDKVYVKQQLIKRTTSPITWVVALGLVVLLFIVGIL